MSIICYVKPSKNVSTHLVAWFSDPVLMPDDTSLPCWFGEDSHFMLTSFYQKYLYALATVTPFYHHRADEKDVEDWLKKLRYGFPEATGDMVALAMAYVIPKRCAGDPEALRQVALDKYAAILSPYTPARAEDELGAVHATPTNRLLDS